MMNATMLLENALLHNGMNVGKSAPQKETLPDVQFSSRPILPHGTKKERWAFLIPILLMLLLGILISLPLDESGMYRVLDSMMLVPRNEPYTALYFEYYDDLPRTAVMEEMINFTFTIKNSEGYDKEYKYNTYILAGNAQEKIPVADGAVTVKDGEEASISGAYIFKETYGQGALFVEIPESGQKIHFILRNEI
jgi:hypothetical protein